MRLIDDAGSFPRWLREATLAVATFGVTAYELAFLGVPAVLVSHSEENAASAARYARHGAAVDLGFVNRVRDRDAVLAIEALLNDSVARRRLARAGRALVDGAGAERLAELVNSLQRGRTL